MARRPKSVARSNHSESLGMNFDFKGRRALVTGAASGIGAGVAERLIAEGASVIACDLDGAALQSKYGALEGVQIAAFDVADPIAVQQAFDDGARQGPIEIVVHAAAIVRDPTPVSEMAFEDWQRVINVNLGGTFNVNRAAVKSMLALGHGRIVNFGSIAASEGTAGISAYNAAKAGVSALTSTLAKEVAAHDIAVNCIVPAGVRTPMVDDRDVAWIQMVTRRIARGRLAEVSEICDAVLWLCAKENSFTTGQSFNFAGART